MSLGVKDSLEGVTIQKQDPPAHKNSDSKLQIKNNFKFM
jgi:hypothetical protein